MPCRRRSSSKMLIVSYGTFIMFNIYTQDCVTEMCKTMKLDANLSSLRYLITWQTIASVLTKAVVARMPCVPKSQAKAGRRSCRGKLAKDVL